MEEIIRHEKKDRHKLSRDFASRVYQRALNGKVVEGEIKPGDIAKQGSAACLVISAGMCNH
jgi:hypothetical protein